MALRVQNSQIKKYAYIDALRGWAILGVVLVHSSQWVPPVGKTLSQFAGEGARGVQLFYLASALTLFLSMAERTKNEERPIASFFIRRFFRIAPLFYLAIIVYTALDGLSARYWAPNGLEWWYIPMTAVFINGWHPETITSVVPGGWSVAVEMTFYLSIPFLFQKLTGIKKTLAALFISLVVSRIAAVSILKIGSNFYPESQQYLVSSFSFLCFFSQLPVFITGILLYHVILRYPSTKRLDAHFLLAFALFLFLAFITVSTLFDLLPKHILYGFAFFVFALSLHYYPNRFFVNPCTIWIGKLSFSIYLVHFLVLKQLRNIFQDGFCGGNNMGFVLAFALVIALSASISYVLFRIVEIPGISLGKTVIRKI